MARKKSVYVPSDPYEVLQRRIDELENNVRKLTTLAQTLAPSKVHHVVEPACTVREAAELLLTNERTLRAYLHEPSRRDQFPSRYVFLDRSHRRYRVLYASEIAKLREMRWRFPRLPR